MKPKQPAANTIDAHIAGHPPKVRAILRKIRATIRKAAPFDLVFANILKGPLIQLAPDMARHVALDGIVILSGLLVVQAESIVDAYVTSGFRLQSRNDLGEWSALVLKRVQ